MISWDLGGLYKLLFVIYKLESLAIPFLHLEDLPADLPDEFAVIVYSIFGFSLHVSSKSPFDELIQRLVFLMNLRALQVNFTTIDEQKALALQVDAGKSTIGGQILFLSGQVDERTIQKYEKEAKDKSRESW
nr:eukaryotic peptide chain release factor GTP-binding subunit ERF3A-like [Ipomoea batatas]